MRMLPLALVLALLAPAAMAQDKSQQMLEVARKARATAEQMKDSLSPEEYAEMIRQADETEQAARQGAFSAPEPPKSLAARISEAHGGRLEWLAHEAACAGYTAENFRTYRLDSGDRDAERDVLCRAAYARWAEYFRSTVNGGGTVAGDPLLAEYDRASRAAVDFYERR